MRNRAGPAFPLFACHDCGLIHRVTGLTDGTTAVCTRCGGVLFRHREDSIERALALNLAALLLFGVANTFPLMSLRLGGREQATTLWRGVTALHETGMTGLAALVFFVAILVPLLEIGGSIAILATVRAGRRPPWLAPPFRRIEALRPWAMSEIYLLGLIVAWVKLRDLASIELDVALLALVAMIVVMVWAAAVFEPHEVWERIAPQTRAVPDEAIDRAAFLVCHGCAQVVRPTTGRDGPDHASCPRCGAALHHRKPDSLTRTTALLIASTILYVPANLYPIMTVISLGKGHPDTILSGVVTLIAVGMWPVALLVFFASITVPVLKLVGLTYLLVSVRRRSTRRRRDRTVMYRLIEFVGRWSMVDIFMISILAALVSLERIATIVPGLGAAAFATVGVLTMLASEAFDPRLIWDAREGHDADRDRA